MNFCVYTKLSHLEKHNNSALVQKNKTRYTMTIEREYSIPVYLIKGSFEIPQYYSDRHIPVEGWWAKKPKYFYNS